MTLDYWDVDIDVTIGLIQNTFTLQNCANTGDPFWCDRITRFSDGQVNRVQALNENLGFQKVSGYDMELEYGWSTGIGDFRASLLASYLENRETEVFIGGPVIDQTGEFDTTTGTGLRANAFPRWRALGSLDWSRGPWAASHQTRYIIGALSSQNTDGRTYRLRGASWLLRLTHAFQ